MTITKTIPSAFGTAYEFDDGATIVVNAQGRVPRTEAMTRPLDDYKQLINKQ